MPALTGVTGDRGGRRPRVLLLLLDFARWEPARPLGYSVGFGFEDGLRQNGFDCTVLPLLGSLGPETTRNWILQTERALNGQTFDQVWIWLVHVAPPRELLEWLKTVAPVRVGVIIESLQYSAADTAIHPVFGERAAAFLAQLPYLTHVLAFDEADVELINARGAADALWCPGAIPASFMRRAAMPVERRREVAFFGTVYEKRRVFLSAPGLEGLIAFPPTAEEGTDLPERFDRVGLAALARLEQQGRLDLEFLRDYHQALRALRVESFNLLLQHFARWRGSVSLPSFVRAVTGRVFEAMVAGTPVITWRIPDRPGANSLFRDGVEILQFDAEHPETFPPLVRLLTHEPEVGARLAERAREKMLRCHTAELRVAQIQSWIATGCVPDHRDSPPAHEPLEVDRYLMKYRAEVEAGLVWSERGKTIEHVVRAITERIQLGDLAGATDLTREAITRYPELSELSSVLLKLEHAGHPPPAGDPGPPRPV